MNKELEMLQKFLDEYLTLCEKLHTNQQEKMLLDKNSPYNVLKTYLETIDNASPSEALEMLKGIEYVADVLKVNHKIGSRDIANQEIKEMVDRLNYRIPTIKQALIKSQEQEKVLKIIIEKEVDIYVLRVASSVEHYNNVQDLKHLTQEEFDLVKRYLGVD